MANVSELTLKFKADTSNAIKEIEKLQSKTSSVAKKSNGILSSIGKALKRIVLYRGIRSVISAIGSAMKTGIDNMYQFSKIGNGTFANALDSIATSVQYLTNSLGAALAPVIESLTPLITNIVDALAGFNNKVAQLFSYMNGKTTYMKATKSLKEYTKAVNEAKTATIGLDELNILSQSKDSNFEETPINVEQAEKSKKIFEAIKVIVIAIGSIMAAFKIAEIIASFQRLGSIISGIGFSPSFMAQLTTISSIAKTGLVIGIEFAITAYVAKKGVEAIDKAAEEKAQELASAGRERVDKIIENQKFDMSKFDANGNPKAPTENPFDFDIYNNPNKIYDNLVDSVNTNASLNASQSTHRESTIVDDVMSVVNNMGESIWNDIQGLFGGLFGKGITIKNADGKTIAEGVLDSDNRYQSNLIGR